MLNLSVTQQYKSLVEYMSTRLHLYRKTKDNKKTAGIRKYLPRERGATREKSCLPSCSFRIPAWAVDAEWLSLHPDQAEYIDFTQESFPTEEALAIRIAAQVEAQAVEGHDDDYQGDAE